MKRHPANGPFFICPHTACGTGVGMQFQRRCIMAQLEFVERASKLGSQLCFMDFGQPKNARQTLGNSFQISNTMKWFFDGMLFKNFSQRCGC
jgi:hypothetical protein